MTGVLSSGGVGRARAISNAAGPGAAPGTEAAPQEKAAEDAEFRKAFHKSHHTIFMEKRN